MKINLKLSFFLFLLMYEFKLFTGEYVYKCPTCKHIYRNKKQFYAHFQKDLKTNTSECDMNTLRIIEREY